MNPPLSPQPALLQTFHALRNAVRIAFLRTLRALAVLLPIFLAIPTLSTSQNCPGRPARSRKSATASSASRCVHNSSHPSVIETSLRRVRTQHQASRSPIDWIPSEHVRQSPNQDHTVYWGRGLSHDAGAPVRSVWPLPSAKSKPVTPPVVRAALVRLHWPAADVASGMSEADSCAFFLTSSVCCFCVLFHVFVRHVCILCALAKLHGHRFETTTGMGTMCSTRRQTWCTQACGVCVLG